MNFTAIDPGANGGMATHIDGEIKCYEMPKTEHGVLELLRAQKIRGASHVFIEQVSGFIGKQQPGSAMFKFGEGFGFLKGASMALRLEVKTITPQTWQKFLGIGKKKDFNYEAELTKGERKGKVVTKNRWKEVLADHARMLFPNHCVDEKTADAMLILYYVQNNYD